MSSRSSDSRTVFDATGALAKIDGTVSVSLWSFLPLLLVFLFSVFRLPPFRRDLAGALAGALVAVLHDPESVAVFAAAPDLPLGLALLKGAWSALANGYISPTGEESIDLILTRGGMSSMMNTVWLIVTGLGVWRCSGARGLAEATGRAFWSREPSRLPDSSRPSWARRYFRMS